MSYILEALKKSDQQRQRSAAPTLSSATIAVETTRKPVYYGLLAVLLLGAGIAIGLLRPWQAELPAPEAKYIAAKAPSQVSQQAAPTPLYGPSEMAGKSAQVSMNQPPVLPAAPKIEKPQAAVASVKSGAAVSAVPAEKPADAAQRAIPVTELPASIQQEIPAMTIQFHAYSSIPANRLVSINSLMLHEGESLMPGLKLEQITVEGMIFSYKGYRFQRGIR